MALEVPGDIPVNNFTRAGLMSLDGDVFEGKNKIGTGALLREIEYVKRNVAEEELQTQSEWQQARNIFMLWCFSHRAGADDHAINAFLNHIGFKHLSVPHDAPPSIFGAIEARYNQASIQHTSPAEWIKRKPPPQRLPSTTKTPIVTDMPVASQARPVTSLPLAMILNSTDDEDSISPKPSLPPVDFNTNPKFQGRYNFTDHRQEYEGFQFQCIFRCLKDGKHCRKAPVREMNRHLRDRHHFRQGFKIAGVDWEKKRWRGAGADHEECVGKIVAKESADDSEDSEGEAYVVQ